MPGIDALAVQFVIALVTLAVAFGIYRPV